MWRCAIIVSVTLGASVGGCHRKKPTPLPITAGSSPLPVAASHHPPPAPSASPPVDAGPHAEGKLTLRLAQGGEVELEYSPGGARTRVGVKGLPGGGPSMAAIVDWTADKLWLLMASQKAYAEMDLGQLRQVAPRLGRWQSKSTGRSAEVAGTPCQIWELTDGTYRVSTCLAPGPLRADVATLEKAVKSALPDWAQRILTEGQMPLRVTVNGPGGQTLWDQRAVAWTFGPVASGDFDIPAGYHRVAWQRGTTDPAKPRRPRPERPRSGK